MNAGLRRLRSWVPAFRFAPGVKWRGAFLPSLRAKRSNPDFIGRHPWAAGLLRFARHDASDVIPERPQGESGSHEHRPGKVVFMGSGLPLRSSRNDAGRGSLVCRHLT
jgi:hypothetical protein